MPNDKPPINREERPAPERSDFVCERGHHLWKYYLSTSKFGHRLLCPICDADVIHDELKKDS